MGSSDKLYQDLHARFEQHVERFEQHEMDDVMKFDKLVAAQQRNTDAVSNLTISVTSLVENTSSVVQLHKDLQGAARVGKGVQNFMLWLLKWGFIGAGISAAIMWVSTHFKH